MINSPPPPAPSPHTKFNTVHVGKKRDVARSDKASESPLEDLFRKKYDKSPAEPFTLDISQSPKSASVLAPDEFRTVHEPPRLSPSQALYDFLMNHISRSTQSLCLQDMLNDLNAKANVEIPSVLKNGNAGSPDHSLNEISGSIVTIAHVLPASDNGKRGEVILSSGFAILDGSLIATCAHPLHQINAHCRSYDANEQLSNMKRTRTVIITNSGDIIPVISVASHLVMSDILLLNIPEANKLQPLRVSPYPCPMGNPIQVYNLHDTTVASGTPKSIWSWQDSEITLYQDRSGREAATGTYDELNTLLFDTIPQPGSSGGPIIDRETKAVVGVTRGSEVSYAVRKERGFGTPAESLFNVFRLDGF